MQVDAGRARGQSRCRLIAHEVRLLSISSSSSSSLILALLPYWCTHRHESKLYYIISVSNRHELIIFGERERERLKLIDSYVQCAVNVDYTETEVYKGMRAGAHVFLTENIDWKRHTERPVKNSIATLRGPFLENEKIDRRILCAALLLRRIYAWKIPLDAKMRICIRTHIYTHAVCIGTHVNVYADNGEIAEWSSGERTVYYSGAGWG